MKDVLESHEVVRKTFSSIIDVDMCTKPELSGHLQIPISPINNFILMDSFIFAFKSYDIEEHLILSEKFKGVIKHGNTQDITVRLSFICSILLIIILQLLYIWVNLQVLQFYFTILECFLWVNIGNYVFFMIN